jgi:hypothetical protein
MESVDTLNASTVFLIRFLRAVRTQNTLNTRIKEYDEICIALGDLRMTIKSHPSSRTATLRAVDKRLEHLSKYLRGEYRTASRRIEAESAKRAASSNAKSSRAARLIAHFIIAEASKLNDPFRETLDANLNHVSHVPETAFTDARKITSAITALTNDDSIGSIDFLEGMDSAL